MVSLRTILSKKMPTGSQPEEPFDAMAFAHQQTEWYNNAEGHLDQEDGYDCPICRNKGYLRVVTEEGGIPNAWMRPCQCQKVRQSIRQMRRSGLQHIIQDYTFAKFQAGSSSAGSPAAGRRISAPPSAARPCTRAGRCATCSGGTT